MTFRRIPVDAKRQDWPRLVADQLNRALTELTQIIDIAGAAAFNSIAFISLSGDANDTEYDGILLSGDAQTTFSDYELQS